MNERSFGGIKKFAGYEDEKPTYDCGDEKYLLEFEENVYHNDTYWASK